MPEKDNLIKLMAVIGLMFGVIGAVQQIDFLMDGFGRKNTVHGLLYNKNLWSSAQLLTLPFCIYILRFSKKWKTIGIIAATGLLVSIFISMTRSVMVGLFAMTFIVSLFNKKIRKWSIVLAICCVVAVFIFGYKRFFDTQTLTYRFEVWSQTLNMIKDYPMGVGAGNWQIELANYSDGITTPDAFKRVFFAQPHNDFLWSFAETGIAGGLVFLSIFGLGLYYAFKTRNILVMCGVIGFVCNAFFSSPSDRSFHNMILMVYLSLVVPVVGKWKSKPIAIVCMLLCTTVMYLRHVDTVLLSKAHNWQLSVKEFSKISWFTTIDQQTTPVAYWKAVEYHKQKKYDKALDNFRIAHKQNHNHVHNLNFIGVYALQSRQLETAKWYFERALKICPGFELAQENLLKINDVYAGSK